MAITLQGQVKSGGAPVPGVMIRLVGDETSLGGDPHAASDSRGTVGWTKATTGVSGSLWNAWQKFVARDVAGLTWEEFRVEATAVQPSAKTHGRGLSTRPDLFPAGESHLRGHAQPGAHGHLGS